MRRVNFLYVYIKVYTASVEEGRHTGYDWDTLLIAEQPVLTTFENIGNLAIGGRSDLNKALDKWIEEQMLTEGKEFIYKDCPKTPKDDGDDGYAEVQAEHYGSGGDSE